jgi:hypothetical protein
MKATEGFKDPKAHKVFRVFHLSYRETKVW